MSLSRRSFIKSGLMTGAAVALTACQRNVEHKLVSQYQMPEYKLPGQYLWWATTCGECTGGCGVAIKTVEGRAIKMEGIPEHPLSKGRLCARGQSGLQALYHPNRLNGFTSGKGERREYTWDKVITDILDKEKIKGGNALFAVKSLKGTLGGQIIELAKEVGAKIWVVDYPSRLAERQVMKALTGKAELHFYRLEQADYLVTFGGDYLGQGHNVTRANWAYGEFRQGKGRERGTMISFSGRINQTAACSDRWIPCKPGTEGWVALAIGNLLASAGKGAGWPGWARSITLEQASAACGVEAGMLRAVAERLRTARKPLVIADSEAGNYINGIESLYVIHSLNKMLGNLETYEPENVLGVSGGVPRGTVINTEEAVKMLNSEAGVGAIWTFDVDLMRHLPQELKPDELLKKGGRRIAFATFADATTAQADEVIPVLHWMEEFGDQLITGPGLNVYNVQQPAVSPLWTNARSLGDIVAGIRAKSGMSVAVAGGDQPAPTGKLQTLRTLIQGSAPIERWENILARGGVWAPDSLAWEVYPNRVMMPPPPLADPGSPPSGVNPYEGLEPAAVSAWTTTVPQLRGGEKVLAPFATLSLKDGTYGNRPWMQELPDPITTVVWGTWIEMNDQWARQQGIGRHDVVEVTVVETGQKFEGPALPLPSVHPDMIAIPVGDPNPDYSKWAVGDNVTYGLGNSLYGRYGYTNANYGKGGLNPLKYVKANMTQGGGVQWVGSKVTIRKTDKVEMITAMDLRVFNLPREILRFG